MDDAELEALRRKKLLEYQRRLQEEEMARQQQIQAQLQLRALLRRALEPDAFERIERVKLANPELYAQAVRYVLALYQSGRLHRKIKDSELKALLLKLRPPRRESKIKIMDKG